MPDLSNTPASTLARYLGRLVVLLPSRMHPVRAEAVRSHSKRPRTCLIPGRKNCGVYLGHIPVIGLIIAKTKEWILAVRLERNYTKQEVMMMYLNTVSFGNNTYGIKTAAKTYFSKEPWNLNVEEAALLVGMLKNPTFYNPRLFEDRTRDRRNVVLGQMKKYKFLIARSVLHL